MKATTARRPSGRDVAAQCRHLEGLAVRDRRHRAVLDPGRHRAEAGFLQPRRHIVGQERRRDVDIGDRLSEQRVAHRAADEPALPAERIEHGARFARGHPGMAFGIELHFVFSGAGAT
ncbi:MAG: hypothetical protein WDM81_02670 [Rhizomicrobium sp.]